MTLEQGKPLEEARAEIDHAASFVRWYAEEGRRMNAEGVTSHLRDAEMLVRREPLGVVGAVTPWHFPSAMLTRKAAAALAGGRTVVAHPSSHTLLSALALAELADRAGLPPGTFNVVLGDAEAVVGRLCDDACVRAPSSIGSTEVGRLVAARCAPTMKNERRVRPPHPEVLLALVPGVELQLDDGEVRLVVESCGPDHAETRVAVGGALSDRKGVGAVGAVLPLSALTEKDRRDLGFGFDMGADWVALPFVQRPENIQEVRGPVQGRADVMAKPEKPAAIEHLDEIVRLSDAVMVARGDPGVEMPPERVPIVQRRILRACREAGEPVIVATQMLQSMITAPTPTRAEASDVATAIHDGADAVVLSAEAASGRYPVGAVRMMDRIVREVEQDPHHQVAVDAAHPEPEPHLSDAICCALRRAVGLLHVAAAVTYTGSGHTSPRAARERPAAPILSMGADPATARRMALVRGVHSVSTGHLNDLDEVTSCACRAVREEGFASPGDSIAITAGVPFGTAGSTNPLELAAV